jgi:hypothetical protein
MSSNNAGVARLTGLAALGVAILYVVSVPVGSLAAAPASDASASEVLRFVSEHRTGLLVSVVLDGVAFCALMPITFAGLRELLGVGGGLAARLSFACALVTAALVGVVLVLAALPAYAAPDIEASLAKLLVDGSNLAVTASAWTTVPCALGMGLALRRTHLLSRPAVVLALSSAAIESISAISLARGGALSPTGIALVAPAVFALWMAVVGMSLLRSASTVAEPAPAGA